MIFPFICDNNKAGFLFTKMRFFHYKFSVSLSKLKQTKDKSINGPYSRIRANIEITPVQNTKKASEGPISVFHPKYYEPPFCSYLKVKKMLYQGVEKVIPWNFIRKSQFLKAVYAFFQYYKNKFTPLFPLICFLRLINIFLKHQGLLISDFSSSDNSLTNNSLLRRHMLGDLQWQWWNSARGTFWSLFVF